MTGVSLTFAGGSELLTCLLGVTEHADDGMRLIQGSCGLPSNLLGFLLDKRSLIPQFGVSICPVSCGFVASASWMNARASPCRALAFKAMRDKE